MKENQLKEVSNFLEDFFCKERSNQLIMVVATLFLIMEVDKIQKRVEIKNYL